MKKNEVEKFLQGKTDDRETRIAEEVLNRRETVSTDQLESTAEDSLLLALRAEAPPQDVDAIREIASRLEQMIPQPEISAAEIKELLEPADHPEGLGLIGKYQITQHLASGGMGLVFRATDTELDREVCLKLLHPNRAHGGEARERFARETRSIARLNCERIMPILDIGSHRELPFLVMPLLEGMSLRTRLLRDGEFSPSQTVAIAIQIAEGLEFAHQMGVLHRDIKPDNLWITPSDDIKLFDFGLARSSDEPAPITHERTLLGTPSYMSPEQVTGKPLDGRSDLFSLGVVMVEMSTGQSPFRKNNLISTLMSVASDEVEFSELDPQGKISAPLRAIIAGLLQKDPDRRPASASEVIGSLKSLSPESLTDIPRPELAATAGRGGTWWPMVMAGLAGFACCLGALALWQLNDKGTLVVETDDPQVEVRIAGEAITVIDPLTSRTYEIRIGEVPLPSGVYQLELAEGDGGLVFSSQTIAIRRGQRTIVTVELRPPSKLAAANEPPAVEAEPSAAAVELVTGFIPPLTPVPTERIADSSFDLAAREKFGETLASIPALPLEEHFTAGRLSKFATVQKPTPLVDASGWSLEVAPRGSSRKSNSDSTLYAALDSYVWIFDLQEKVRYAIPSPGNLISYEFDNRYPNLMATVNWMGEFTETGDYDPVTLNRYQIQVWRLGESGAELVSSFPSTTSELAWDQGYRLFHVVEDNIVAHRLDTGKSFELTQRLDNRLVKKSVSPGGRFLATTSSSSGQQLTNVYDLHRGKFVTAIRASGNLQWRKDDAALAVKPNQGNFLEIWRTDQPELLQRVELIAPDSNSRQSQADPGIAELDTDFVRVAQFTPRRDLSIRSLLTQRESSSSMEGLRQENNPTLVWQEDGSLAIRGKTVEYVWRAKETDVHGTLSIGPELVKRLQRRPNTEQPTIFAVRGKDLFLQRRQRVDQRNTFRVGSESEFQYTKIEFGQLGLRGSSEVPINAIADIELLSPDGKYVFIPDRKSHDKNQLKEVFTDRTIEVTPIIFVTRTQAAQAQAQLALESRMRSLESRMRSAVANLSYATLKWSNNSQYLLLAGSLLNRNDRGYQMVCEVWNAHQFEKVTFDSPNFVGSTGQLGPNPTCESFGDGFLLQCQANHHEQLWYLQPAIGRATLIEVAGKGGAANDPVADDAEEGGKKSNPDESTSAGRVFDLGDWKLAQVAGEYLFFNRDLKQKSKTAWLRCRIVDGRLEPEEELIFLKEDDFVLSPRGDFFYRVQHDPAAYTVENDRGTPVRSFRNLDQYPSTVTIGRWPTENGASEWEVLATLKSRDPWHALRWHPDGRYFAVNENFGERLSIFDLSSQTWNRVDYRSGGPRSISIHAVDFGWLVATDHRLLALNHAGELLATFLFYADASEEGDDDPLATGRWILADGRILANQSHSQLQLLRRRGNQMSVESTIFSNDDPRWEIPQIDRLNFLDASE